MDYHENARRIRSPFGPELQFVCLPLVARLGDDQVLHDTVMYLCQHREIGGCVLNADVFRPISFLIQACNYSFRGWKSLLYQHWSHPFICRPKDRHENHATANNDGAEPGAEPGTEAGLVNPGPSRLESLINSDVLRPLCEPNSALAERWQSYSITVATWLFNSVSDVLYLKITAAKRKQDLKFADDLECKLEGYSAYDAANILTSFVEIREADYADPEAYINADLAGYAMAKETGIKHDPYGLLVRFLKGVEAFDWPVTDRVFRKLITEGREPADYTERLFFRVVNEIQVEIMRYKASKCSETPARAAGIAHDD
ncbi:hypothetical protein N7481_007518 [Penicillium waksmanii]|uniref:uncharacterized protein n=1 Tax=Penicillium waksmanii TaxID=69791 RepID=UPI002546A67B|nr:uncharacterized protein N7481_007518 [Penicillium waksmanii]KAJ5980220.1 hypothetical protein N7481_007518 [Penicillium waksmanii]